MEEQRKTLGKGKPIKQLKGFEKTQDHLFEKMMATGKFKNIDPNDDVVMLVSLDLQHVVMINKNDMVLEDRQIGNKPNKAVSAVQEGVKSLFDHSARGFNVWVHNADGTELKDSSYNRIEQRDGSFLINSRIVSSFTDRLQTQFNSLKR